MSDWTDVTREELDAFVKAYPRPLVRDVAMMCEPYLISWNDFTLGNWPDSVVAKYRAGDPPGTQEYWGPESGWQIKKSATE